MKKEEVSEVIKDTKIGKIALLVIILGIILCLSIDILPGIVALVICIVVAYFLLMKGKRELENSFTNEGNATAMNYTPKAAFSPTKKIGSYLWVDDTNKKWCIPQGKLKKTVYSYSDIMNFELIEDGNTVTSGGLGRAVAGGLLFGGVGAIVGGATGGKKTKATCSKLQVKIVVKNINSPVLYIDLIAAEIKKDTPIYKEAIVAAQEIVAVLQIICSSIDTSN